ncbi:GHMP kinase [Methanofollis liminatans DSM 4140]|uniref:Pantoate kinase n=1 Tax=Methanofollis liminatans DSM 4140 TaxID=28892 RepID=J1L3D6_9EURY|nr:pantoate kinase [Methanofollis liminatans]EJG07597.1 GHMP kinase [Methanofollis liminatans DSM 4140]
MVRTAVAFSPGHISGYFMKVAGESPATTGSLGAGIVIEEGVVASVSTSDVTEVVVGRNDEKGTVLSETAGSPPVEYALERLGVNARVETRCSLPIGAGFGLSAAALLASITAVDALFDLGMDRREIAALAHEAEVVHSTGLGDVAACQGGGIVCRTTPGPEGEIRRFYPEEAIWAVSFGPLPTPEVIGSQAQIERIAAAFPEGCPSDLPEFFRLSRAFAGRSGLVPPEVGAVLAACDAAGVRASMTMLGRGAFAAGDGAEEVFSRFAPPIPLHIAREGFRLLEVRA